MAWEVDPMTGSVLLTRPAAAKTEEKVHHMILRLKTLPWARIVVDALLLAGMLTASSRLLPR